MKEISVESLPLYSSWPARILGVEAFDTAPRSVRKMLREYGRDKFGRYLESVQVNAHCTIDNIRELERGVAPRTPTCFSLRGRLFLGTTQEIERRNREHFLTAIRPAMRGIDTVIELGAGYGYNLHLLSGQRPRHVLVGGELTQSGVRLGQLLAQGRWSMYRFNFYDPDWKIFDKVESDRILVLTRHSVEMLQRSEPFFLSLYRHRKRIVSVIQFEPLYELMERTSLLAMMSRRYIELNDYNRDLWSTLSTSKGVAVDRVVPHAFGSNPLFPESVIRWHFK